MLLSDFNFLTLADPWEKNYGVMKKNDLKKVVSYIGGYVQGWKSDQSDRTILRKI